MQSTVEEILLWQGKIMQRQGTLRRELAVERERIDLLEDIVLTGGVVATPLSPPSPPGQSLPWPARLATWAKHSRILIKLIRVVWELGAIVLQAAPFVAGLLGALYKLVWPLLSRMFGLG